MKFNISILEYLGKLNTGVLVLFSIVYNDQYYEATLYYNADQLLVTASESLEEILEHPLIDDPEYPELVRSLLKKIVPYSEIYSRLDDIDFSRWKMNI